MDASRVEWRKSSYSTGNGGACVEVGAAAGLIAVRDSKDPDGPALAFSGRDWAVFVGQVKQERSGLA